MHWLPPLSACIAYAAYCIFHFYMQRHAKTFRGESIVFGFLLNLFVLAALLAKYALLAFYGMERGIGGAVALFFIGFVLTLLAVKLEPGISHRFPALPLLLSLCGFGMIPLAGYALYTQL